MKLQAGLVCFAGALLDSMIGKLSIESVRVRKQSLVYGIKFQSFHVGNVGT